MIKINKNSFLTQCSVFLNSPLYLKYCKSLNVKANTSQLKYKYHWSRLVFVRSPKHFNKGKIQVLFSNTKICLLIPLNKPLIFLAYRKHLFYKFFKQSFYFLPFVKVQHYKIFIKQTLVFYFGNKKSTI